MSTSSLKPAPARNALAQGWAGRACAFFASERGRTTLASLLLAMNLVLLVVYFFFNYKGYFHSDSSVKNLLAQEMHETSSFFPPGWNYVNKDLMVLFGQLGVWPLLFFFDNSYTLYAISGVLGAIFILASAWWFTGLLGGSTWQRVLALAALAGGISAGVAEDMFGQASYGVVLMFTCLITVLSWKSMSAEPRRQALWWGLLFVLVALVSWSNPQRAAASYLLPLFCGLAAYLWGDDWKPRLRAALPVVAVSVVAFGVGVVLSVLTLARVNNNAGAGAARWLDFDGMASNVVDTLHALLGLLGGLPAGGGDVLSGPGMYAAVRLLAALVLLVLIGRRIVLMCGSPVARARFIGGLVAGVSLCFLFLQATTTVADMTDPMSSARYLTPMVVLGLMLLFCSPLAGMSRLGALLTTGLAVLLATSSVVPSSPGSMIYTGWNNAQREALVAELKAMGLRYGYATYWNAGALTVLSGSEVKIRQIMIPNGLPLPMRHLSADRWYEPEAWQGETFLLMDDKEVAATDWGALTRYVGQPTREARIGAMRVFVFKENISLELPNWSSTLRKPFRMNAAADSAKMVGKWNDAAGVLQTKAGEAGFLQYGPYRPLGRGHYTVTYDVSGRADPATQVVATVDAVTLGGNRILGSAEVRGDGTAQHTLQFTLDHPVLDLELRVLANGVGEVDYKGLTLTRQP